MKATPFWRHPDRYSVTVWRPIRPAASPQFIYPRIRHNIHKFKASLTYTSGEGNRQPCLWEQNQNGVQNPRFWGQIQNIIAQFLYQGDIMFILFQISRKFSHAFCESCALKKRQNGEKLNQPQNLSSRGRAVRSSFATRSFYYDSVYSHRRQRTTSR